MSDTPAPSLKTASFGGGCFWCLEPFFEKLKGVEKVESGYQGGDLPNPTYRQVTSGTTGHAEVVQVTYDPDIISYGELVQVFFMIHDPTQLNRQGPDVGSHYRTALVPTSGEQEAVARAYLSQLEKAGIWDRPIVTKIETRRTFFPAEGYHQDFMAKNPRHGYILRWDRPKVEALKAMFPRDYRADFLWDAV